MQSTVSSPSLQGSTPYASSVPSMQYQPQQQGVALWHYRSRISVLCTDQLHAKILETPGQALCRGQSASTLQVSCIPGRAARDAVLTGVSYDGCI